MRLGSVDKLAAGIDRFYMTVISPLLLMVTTPTHALSHLKSHRGSVIGPSLFLIYINDLPDTLNSKVRLLADDTILYNTAGEHKQLQEDLVSPGEMGKEVGHGSITTTNVNTSLSLGNDQ
mgnify:CR=1 FL=1